MILRTLREARGLSRAKLADQAGVTAAYVSLLENGSRLNPATDVLHSLARALELDDSERLQLFDSFAPTPPAPGDCAAA